MVYIVGDVTRSGAFYVQNGQPLTILDLVSLAQGPNRTASMSHTSLIRTAPDGSILKFRLDLTKVMNSEEKNSVADIAGRRCCGGTAQWLEEFCDYGSSGIVERACPGCIHCIGG